MNERHRLLLAVGEVCYLRMPCFPLKYAPPRGSYLAYVGEEAEVVVVVVVEVDDLKVVLDVCTVGVHVAVVAVAVSRVSVRVTEARLRSRAF